MNAPDGSSQLLALKRVAACSFGDTRGSRCTVMAETAAMHVHRMFAGVCKCSGSGSGSHDEDRIAASGDQTGVWQRTPLFSRPGVSGRRMHDTRRRIAKLSMECVANQENRRCAQSAPFVPQTLVRSKAGRSRVIAFNSTNDKAMSNAGGAFRCDDPFNLSRGLGMPCNFQDETLLKASSTVAHCCLVYGPRLSLMKMSHDMLNDTYANGPSVKVVLAEDIPETSADFCERAGEICIPNPTRQQ